MNAKRAAVAGFVGTAVMTGLMLLAPLVGFPRMAIGELLSTLLALSSAFLPTGPITGWTLHAAFGIALALVYAAFFARRLPGGPVGRGALFGVLVFLVAQLTFMPLVGAGVFSRGDSAMILGSLIGHLVYGGTVGAIYGEPVSATPGLAPLGVALLLLAGGRRAHGQAPAPAAPPAAETTVASPEAVDAGRKIFHGKGTCHACHGDQLQGGPVAPSLRGSKWRNIDGSFDAILKRVQGGQPGTLMVSHPGDIDDAETVQVATYVWAVSQGKAKP